MEHRVTKLETNYESICEDIDCLVMGQNEINKKLDTVLTAMAEARGAAKLGKIVGGFFILAISTVSGLIGGNIAAAHKVQDGIQQVILK